MWKSNLTIALRVLGRNRTISLINAVGRATVSGQTWLAARTNPADALRYG